jgi:hypothetical protein
MEMVDNVSAQTLFRPYMLLVNQLIPPAHYFFPHIGWFR